MHRHEWWQRSAYTRIVMVCDTCGKEMCWDEVERRLNATEFLSAEDAERIGTWELASPTEEDYGRDAKMLWNYAKTLRGE